MLNILSFLGYFVVPYYNCQGLSQGFLHVMQSQKRGVAIMTGGRVRGDEREGERGGTQFLHLLTLHCKIFDISHGIFFEYLYLRYLLFHSPFEGKVGTSSFTVMKC